MLRFQVANHRLDRRAPIHPPSQGTWQVTAPTRHDLHLRLTRNAVSPIATRITNDAVADCIGQGREVEYGQLVNELSAKHQVCQRTAKSAVKRAADAGVIAKNLGGRYERAA
jgi:hypothetical protein